MPDNLTLAGKKRREATRKRDELFVKVWRASQTVDEVVAKATVALAENHVKGYHAFVSRITALKWVARLRAQGTHLKVLEGEVKRSYGRRARRATGGK
jgi:hypothetical protein